MIWLAAGLNQPPNGHAGNRISSRMVVLYSILGALGLLIFLLILIVTSLPSPTITRLVKRYLQQGDRP